MATTKKKPAQKTTAAKAAPKTKAAAAKTTTRKVTTKKSPAKKQQAVAAGFFRPTKEEAPFLSFTFTTQSLYWLILSALVLALGAWVMYLNVKIQDIYDQVEINTQLSESYVKPMAEKAKTATPAAQ
jgi:hypothetical protein